MFNRMRALIIIMAVLTAVTGASADQDITELSIEELCNLTIITDTSPKQIPGSVTTITAEDIRITPARNILDLLEIYVPGALWMNHHEGPHPGIRGIISDRNYKLLLLVNGINMNQSAHNGVSTELENWDLNDIERIEVVRGPGSVTYGPGAIAGVINIVTKRPTSTPQGHEVGAQYFSQYDSYGLYSSDSVVKEDYSVYLYASAVRTFGHDSKGFLVSGSEAGEVGKDFTSGRYVNPPHEYMTDYRDRPQVKAHAEVDFLEENRLWLRYTTSGSTLFQPWPQYSLSNDGDFDPLYWKGHRQFTAAFENRHDFSDAMGLRTTLSYQSLDNDKGRYEPGNEGNQGPQHGSNKMYDFAEDEFFAQTLLNIAGPERLQFAVGAEVSYQTWGPGWGDNKRDLLLGDAPDIISGPDSEAAGNIGQSVYSSVGEVQGFYVGDGWHTLTYSFLGEALVDLGDVDVILSARNDKNELAKNAFSPRVGIVYDNENLGVFKFVAQQSVRLNTAAQLKLQDIAGESSDPEILTGYEIIFDAKPFDAFDYGMNVFYYDIESIGWVQSSLSSTVLGDLSLYGVELEGTYTMGPVVVGASHSFVKQLDWDLRDGVNNSGISYADYNVSPEPGVVYTGTGNDINNWSNHATKVYANVRLSPKLLVHVDAQLFWAFEGAKDGLEMIDNGVAGTSSEESVGALVRTVEDHDAYEMDLRVNASVNYRFTDNLSASLFLLNLASIGDNKRYSYDAGIVQASPHRACWVEEPFVIGCKLSTHF
ncbi:MAG: TonB-dependent receptor plug domain-containing protein [Thermodesulfobacteriota bacterium]|nr:TonB-dependent receptor plug domain-containing protein [Thermodesulfobacteriota bacterium]